MPSPIRPSTLNSPGGSINFQRTPPRISDPLVVVPPGLPTGGPLEIGEAYVRGEWTCEHLDEFMAHIFREPVKKRTSFERFALLSHVVKEKLLNPQRGKGAYHVGDFHYNLGNPLFEKMLDRTMSYTCGYWPHASNLLSAQNAKLDLICRKLRLEPGMTVADIGCGWGNFARFAATNYGVSVVGVTVSTEQANFAREFCQGLPVTILLQDYRSLEGQFDRVVSIEMIEAVGKKNLPVYFETVHRILRDGGLFALEVISAESYSRNSNWNLDQYILWLVKYIFPNGYLPSIKELASPCSELFLLQDWHSFGEDYDKTLMAWASNFRHAWPEISHGYDESFKRRWEFYLYSCAALFRVHLVHLYQILYSKGPTADRLYPVR
ncbi:MAG: cyclopropane fatty acyl phospholipid synthase [Bdellovibrionales bacterium]|nr:cyclopropane fatty acyl phospholipid synthase [Bdellovibrionales bacterium]